ncbi:endonuclease domain-containing protein [Nordella sp. HKS 07]|nr:endonuclease domain-containing protein [Nordella sp. HKS 07]
MAAPRRARAKRMRREPTEAEKLFWWEIRDRRLEGHKFKRQYLVAGYIADFVCLERKLIIELDGGQHSETTEYDAKRSADLQVHGFRVLRIWNAEIFKNMEGVIDAVLAELGSSSPSPSP